MQRQRRLPNVAIDALFHDHFFAILFIFTGIFLVNYVLMNSAAAVFGNVDSVVLNFLDVSLLMDQIFSSPIAPANFFLVLFLSSQITGLTRNIGGRVILRHFFGVDLSTWFHHVLFKALSIIPALCCVKIAGAEGIYQLLIFCQVILAMLLPSSVIPLFRVASSRFIMGTFKISWYLELLAFFAFLGMLASSIIFTIEMLFGNSSWIMNLKGGMGSSVTVSYSILLLIACMTLGLTLYLAVTPINSASDGSDTQKLESNLLKDPTKLFEGREEGFMDLINHVEHQESAIVAVINKPMEAQSDNSILEFNLGPSADFDRVQPELVPSLITCSSLASQPEESIEVDLKENMGMVSASVLLNPGILQRFEPKKLDEEVVVGVSVPTDKDKDEGDALETEVTLSEALCISSSESLGSSSIKGKIAEGVNDSGSLSKLSGLGRAARRQLAAILDEFWGNLFDFHGKLTQEAIAKRLDVLLGLDLKTVGSYVKADTAGAESSKSFISDADRGPYFPVNLRGCNSTKQEKYPALDISHGVQMGSPTWSQAMQRNTHMQNPCNNSLEPSEGPYSSSHLLRYSDDRDYQPATIHGYQIASYLKDIGAGRSPYSSSMSQLPSTTPYTAASSVQNLRDQVMYARGQNELGSLGTSSLQTPGMSRINRLQIERPYYEPSILESGENINSSAYTKKYHSSPDISALIASSRNSFLNDGRWSGPIGPRQSLGRTSYDQSQYLHNVSRAGAPLAFDTLSPPKPHREIFSVQPSVNMDAKSLWSIQPFEQLFGVGKNQNDGDGGAAHGSTIVPKESFPYADSEAKLLQALRFCIKKLLKLEGADWLFKQDGGSDEELIDRVAATERYLHEVDVGGYMNELQHMSSGRKLSSIQSSVDEDLHYLFSLPNCGESCIWRSALVVSFGVWCIRRILEMALVESRPELWGKYTYVLNRLQGTIEPAFSKPRCALLPCACLEIRAKDTHNFNASLQNELLIATVKTTSKNTTTAGMVLDIIKDVEAAISGRKGRTGTAAGDVAFPKGKENLVSVLKRYKRRLSNKPPGTNRSAS